VADFDTQHPIRPPERRQNMPVIFKFASSATDGLFAFTGDRLGAKLPKKHGPWVSKGNVKPQQPIPHRLDRGTVESAIEERGYQMWRMKKREDETE
jgi:hypothetical protein